MEQITRLITDLVSVPLSGLVSVNLLSGTVMGITKSRQVSVPLSGLTSVNYNKSNPYDYVEKFVSVPLSGLVSVNGFGVHIQQKKKLCFRPLIGVSFCKLAIESKFSSKDRMEFSSPYRG